MHVQKSFIIPYSVDQAYSVVNDIISYPQFLANCSHSEILWQQGNEIVASMTVNVKSKEYKLITKNTLTENQRIELDLVDGPFKSLHGYWEFSILGEKTSKVLLSINFELENKLLQFAVKPMIPSGIEKIFNCFCRRLDDLNH